VGSRLPNSAKVLERQGDLEEFFLNKVQVAQIHKNPYFKSA